MTWKNQISNMMLLVNSKWRLMLCLFISVTANSQNIDLFLNAPEVIALPNKEYSYLAINRKFTGIPSLAITKGGTIWATWYAGTTPEEDDNNYVVLSVSNNQGKKWTEKLIIDPDGTGPVRAFDPELWFDPTGKLWVFWAQAIGHEGTIAGVWAMTTDNPDSATPQWTKPRRLTNGIMMCKPTVLSSKEWLLPVSTWRLSNNSAKLISSRDKGLSWQEKGAVNVPKEIRSFDEHMIIERKDKSLWMLVRTNNGIGESISKDEGKTWSKLTTSDIAHPPARIFVRRLNSGNILLVKHGPIDIKTKRSHLMAFISKDDGEKWSRGLLIDERKGVSYPDGQQSDDGTIYIIYDYKRTSNQEVLITNFTEEDILAVDYDRSILKVYSNRFLVSKGGTK
jgi:predicted neuraminidase